MKNIIYKFNAICMVMTVLFFSFSVNAFANDDYSLTDEESSVLLQYFSDTYVKKPPKLYFKYNKKLKNIYAKILGKKNIKKDINGIKLLITLVYITDTFNHSSKENILMDSLFERFMLQPVEYFASLKYFKGKRDAFCSYLGQSYGLYLYNNKISSDKYNRRELFKSKYISSMKDLENIEDIYSCLNKIPSEMPVFD